MECPACHVAQAADSLFCDQCGADLEPTCPKCCAANRVGARFCRKCRTNLSGDETVASPRPTPVADAPPRPAPHLAARILNSAAALEGERKLVTVLFADVKGSMDLAEQMDAEEWSAIMQRFFRILSEGVERFEGFVDKFTGDGIMALFGAPIAHEDHARRACYASLHLRENLKRYADELRRTTGLSFSVRMGLNSGEVVVGKIGDDLRMDYTAQGHTVGLAQRMEQRAAADSAYLTEHTAALVKGYFDLRDLGAFDLKGASAPIGGFELLGVGAHRTRLDRRRARGTTRGPDLRWSTQKCLHSRHRSVRSTENVGHLRARRSSRSPSGLSASRRTWPVARRHPWTAIVRTPDTLARSTKLRHPAAIGYDVRSAIGIDGSQQRDDVRLCYTQIDEDNWQRTLHTHAYCGDTNADEAVDVSDALLALRAAIAGVSCPRECDVDGSASVTTVDSLRILKFSVGHVVNMFCRCRFPIA